MPKTNYDELYRQIFEEQELLWRMADDGELPNDDPAVQGAVKTKRKPKRNKKLTQQGHDILGTSLAVGVLLTTTIMTWGIGALLSLVLMVQLAIALIMWIIALAGESDKPEFPPDTWKEAALFAAFTIPILVGMGIYHIYDSMFED